MEIDELLRATIGKGASDLHIKVSRVPIMRINGILIPQDDLPQLENEDVESIFKQVTSEDQRSTYIRELELDFAYAVPGVGRFRVNASQQMGTLSLVFRPIPLSIPTIDELGLPLICRQLIQKPRGLILMTGPTGCGKSTSLASMIDYLNETSAKSVITIEDPIEFLYSDKKCIIKQRQMGNDTKSFATALKHALRQDPNVIVLGEMRDLDTISTALTTAETGHLVLGTLHTTDAPQTVDRIIDSYPPRQQEQVRLQLSQVLEAILTQALLARKDMQGRVAAFEVLIATSVVRNLIREAKFLELKSVMQMSTKEGMQTLDQALIDLVKRGIVTAEEATMKSSDAHHFKQQLEPNSANFRA